MKAISTTPVAVTAGSAASACSQWGLVDGSIARLFSIENARGSILRVTNIGASIVEMHVPDRDGILSDVVLGFDRPEPYAEEAPYFGSIVGRCANRINSGRFELDGEHYQLDTNNDQHHLHGGHRGFDKRVWKGSIVRMARGQAVRFERVSPAGEEGYPGTLHVSVTYILTDENDLITEIAAKTDATTVCNLAQHAYWNLGGHGSGSVLDHELMISALHYTPVDPESIPTGDRDPVSGTAFDFTTPKPIGRDLAAAGGDPAGYDHNYIVDGAADALRLVAVLHDPASGRIMELRANQPGVQVYTANFLDGTLLGKDGAAYGRHAAVCLETQAIPNAINVPAWQSPILRPGELYRHVMVSKFITDND